VSPRPRDSVIFCHSQNSVDEQRLHVPARITNDMDVQHLITHLVNDAVHARDHLPVLTEAQTGKFLRDGACQWKRLEAAHRGLYFSVGVTPRAFPEALDEIAA